MKICFLICGQPRCIDLVLKKIEELFIDHKISYYICLTNNFKDYENEYNNIFNINNINDNKNIKSLLLINDNVDSTFRNSVNYSKKINKNLLIVDDNFDIYILIRSDFIFDNNTFLDKINDDSIYLSLNEHNSLIKNENKYNDSIIITKNYEQLIKFKFLYDYTLQNNNYLQVNLFNFININKIKCKQIDIDYKLILSRCNIIAISGDSGSGKSTLLEQLTKLFNEQNCIKLETDRYHKWERNDPHYTNYTHLNPYANHLEKMSNDVYNLKIGHEIFAVNYDHENGKFTHEEKIDSSKNLLLCGLHTLYNDKMNDIIDLKIFMDTDRELIKKWKIKRDVQERSYSLEKVTNQILKREKDYNEYIDIQKKNADIAIKFYEENRKISCILTIVTPKYIEKTISHYKNEYNINNSNVEIRINQNYYENIIYVIKMLIS
jgi:uridine kinase